MSRSAIGLAFIVLLLLAGTSRTFAQDCANPPVVTIASSSLPQDVCIPSGFPSTQNPIQFFDDYSWRAFVSMIWPAQLNQRGIPDPAKKPGDVSGPLVFETFKAEWEVFQPNGNDPSSWDVFGGVAANPCQAQISNPTFNDMILASITKFENLGQAGFGNLVGPLVAQNGTYVRYMISYNQKEFEQITAAENKWYIRKNLPQSITFPIGSADLKTSWIIMDNIPQPERFYTRQAWIMDINTGQCSLKTVGLVGMHIVQKTNTRPQWIWSSFEHIDNVFQTEPANRGPLTFRNASGQPPMPTTGNPIPFPPPGTPPPPFNVERQKPIHNSTLATNAKYQTAFKGTVWENYELVMTQWPLQASQPTVPGTPPNTFPGSSFPGSSDTAFANTTMETFDQNSVSFGCMACHNFVMSTTDFLWSLKVNAFPPPSSTLTVPSVGAPHTMTLNATPNSEELRELKQLLESAVRAPRQ